MRLKKSTILRPGARGDFKFSALTLRPGKIPYSLKGEGASSGVLYNAPSVLDLVSVEATNNYHIMKTLITLLAAASCCLAAEVPYTPAGPKAQGALLLLPLQQAKDNSSTSTTPRSAAVSENGTENLEDVNANLSEKLRQQQGSEQGVYHVYLQDGRLQKVQYTTAPITSGQQTQPQQTASNNYNQQQTPEILSPQFAERRGVYFVQVPQERIQALQGNAQQISLQQSSQNFQPSAPAQYNQQESFPVNVRYLPLEDSSAPSSQYRQDRAEEAIVRYLPVPLTEQSGQYSASEQYGQQYSTSGQYGQQYSTGEQQAVVQYSEVQPIQGPAGFEQAPRLHKVKATISTPKTSLAKDVRNVWWLLRKKGKEVVFIWVPSHCGIIGNEQADQGANLARKPDTTSVESINEIPPEDYVIKNKENVWNMWQNKWEQGESKLKEMKPHCLKWETSHRPSRKEETALCRMRIGYC
ncbi:unnamed protein product [Nezara viridula]|uniref:Uncharacterized protein n=1 Tax=Nezara viridula TaxID=85310 RepID=A0A9P0MT54_NEZVI|nr:unnamed protein product [Nezara viridula]